MSDTAALDMPQQERWRSQGRLHLRGALTTAEVDAVLNGVEELSAWANEHGPGLHHHELTDYGPRLARSEDFFGRQPQLTELIECDAITSVLRQLFGEEAVLFKEKVNYKYPGGAGFAPHQDATAYDFVDHHISVLVALDAATIESGCLWFTTSAVREILDNDAGRIDPGWVTNARWEPVEVEPGDLVFFDSLTPHYSETNNSSAPRRAVYLTYNAASHGDHREAYYRNKRSLLAAAAETVDGADRVRISVNDDFLGRPVV